MKSLGHTLWAIPGGHIPLDSTGPEPAFNSHDKLCILNTGSEEAAVRLTLFYPDKDPVGPYPLKVHPRRVRHIRFNDLIDPAAMPLDTDYACLIESSVPVIVQFERKDTSRPANAISFCMAFPVENSQI